MTRKASRSTDPPDGARLGVVLVVDDEPAGRYLLSTVLGGRGYETIEAADGVQALAAARARTVDAVVTDILMPEMDGYQLAREWRADRTLREIPLLFYTATYVETADEKFALSLGADAFLRKPTEPDAIVAAIEEARSRRRDDLLGLASGEVAILRQYNERLISKLEHKLEELREANVQLTRERDFSNRVIETAEMLIVGIDTSHRITMFSAGAEQTTGFSATEVVGGDYLGLLVPADEREAQRTILAGAFASGRTVRGTSPILTSSGETRWVHWSSSPTVGEDGRCDGLLAFGLDVTERRALETAKSNFIATVGHELRTPLTSVIGYGDMLAEMWDRATPTARTEMVENVRANAERMRRLIEELLEVSAMQAEGLHLQPRRVEIGQVLRFAEIVGMPDTHRLTVSAEDDLPTVMCDPERLGRALVKLVENAVKYSPDGGEVRVHAQRRGSDLALSVSDEGVGMDPADAERIFDRFAQVDMSSTREFGGFGLGLFVSREVVAAHGGRILVESSPGEGSTFTILLPMGPEAV